MSDRILEDEGLVVRHSALELFEHWSIAFSGIILILTGIFEMPIARRYYINELPGFAWSADFIISLKIHYIASVVFVAAALFHVVYHGILGHRGMIPRKGDVRQSIEVIKTFFGKGEEPPFHKYLPEQRLAYAGMAVIIGVLIVSGLMKTYKNLINPQMSEGLTLFATWAHNIFFVLFVFAFVGHMAAIILKPNWPMVRGIFTGRVRLDYAKHRHPFWIEEIMERQREPAEEIKEEPDGEVMADSDTTGDIEHPDDTDA
ncbi:MAG: cytochrome b/b6 domain-containing protein [Deltaproteobacteria bacterium]|nr:cytochrome b/b6 domain-containing protein [Deltaproteobacteria bacterium]